MNTDIVDTDTQNKLIAPAGDLTPYPLSQKDKQPDASGVNVPTQEPVITDAEPVVNSAIQQASDAPIQPDAEQPLSPEEVNFFQKNQEAKSVARQNLPVAEEELEVHEDTPEERLERKTKGPKKGENVFFVPETGKAIVTNTDDYDKARFKYLANALQSSYIKRTHNYADFEGDLYQAGRPMIQTIGKMVGGIMTDALTSSMSFVSNIGGKALATIDTLGYALTDPFYVSFKNNFSLNKTVFKDYDQGQMPKLLVNPVFAQMRANGADEQTIKAKAYSMYSFPSVYKLSKNLEQKTDELDSFLRNPTKVWSDTINDAKIMYQGFSDWNSQIKESLNLNPDQYDNPSIVYWGNAVGTTVLCSLGAFAGGMGWILPAVYAAMEWDDAIAEGLQNGKTFEELLPKSYLVAAASLVTERLQILSAVKRFKGIRQMAFKGMASWAFENTAQEVLQDAAIMGTKQVTGIAEYSTMDYLNMVPETALAALVSSVPLGVIVQHNKIRLAKSYMAAGMSEQKAATLADFVMEHGVNAIYENPVILKEFADSLNDVFQTSKVEFVRHTIDESREEQASNQDAENRALNYAATENANGHLVGVINTAQAVAAPIPGYQSNKNKDKVLTTKKISRTFGPKASVFAIDKNSVIVKYGDNLEQKLKRVNSAPSLYTVKLPDAKNLAMNELPLKNQSNTIKDGFKKAYDSLPEKHKKTIGSFNDLLERTPENIINLFAQLEQNNPIIQPLIDNGVKGLYLAKEKISDSSIVVFDAEKDVSIKSVQPISTGKQKLAEPFKDMTEDKIKNMTLEEFLKLTKMDRLFKNPKNGKYAGIADPKAVTEKITDALVKTNLYTQEEASVIAGHFVMIQYIDGIFFGNGPATIETMMQLIPTYANIFMSSAFSKRGEYYDFWKLVSGQNSIFSYDRGVNGVYNKNEKLIKEIFGDKVPTTDDLKQLAEVVRYILKGEKYNGPMQNAYKFLKAEFNKKLPVSSNKPKARASEEESNIAYAYRTLVEFEARLQRTSSEMQTNRARTLSILPVKYEIDEDKKTQHFYDLAILRTLGLWRADNSKGADGFWNTNRDNPQLKEIYFDDKKSSEINIVDEKEILSLVLNIPGSNRYSNKTPDGSDLMKSAYLLGLRGAGGMFYNSKDYGVLVQSLISAPPTVLHESGHAMFFAIRSVLNRYRQFAPKKFNNVMHALEKVYKAAFDEEIDLIDTNNPYDSEQVLRINELFSDLYAKSVLEGKNVTNNDDLNFLLDAIGKTFSVLRNPSTKFDFPYFERIDESKKGAVEEAWNSVWKELNRKEASVNIIQAREKILSAVVNYDKNGTDFSANLDEAINILNALPPSPATIVAKYQLQQAKTSREIGYILQANATLVNAAVEDMYGVRIVNQNLVQQMTEDNRVFSLKSFGKIACTIWQPLKDILPVKLAKALDDLYLYGHNFFEKANTALAEAIQEDGYTQSFVNFARRALQPISRTAKKLDPRLFSSLSRSVFMENKMRMSFMATFNKLNELYNNMSEVEQKALDKAFFDQDWKAVDSFFENIGQKDLANEIKMALDAAYSVFEETDPDGTGIRQTKDYFPRSVKDVDGMIAYMMSTDKYRQIATQMMQQKALGEQAAVLLAQMYPNAGRVEKGAESHLKERSFVVVPEDLRQFYVSPLEALRKYFEDASSSYGNYVFFGKGANLKMRPDAIGEVEIVYIDTKTGKEEKAKFYAYSPKVSWEKNLENSGFFLKGDTKSVKEHNKKVAEVIDGVFFRKSPHPWATVYRTANNICTINNFFSAMTNLVDFAITTYRYGGTNTFAGALAATKGKDAQPMAYEELSGDLYKEFDMDNYKLNRIFNKVFSLSGFTMLDIFGKQSSIDAALISAKEKLLGHNQEIIDKIMLYCGEDQDVASATISDIINDKMTDNVRFFLFNELSGQQPLTLLDVPYYYNTHPNLRVFYQFKTFMIKQADFFLHEVLTKDFKKNPLKALKNTVRFMALLTVFGVPKELIKAILMGQPFDLSDEVISQLLGVGLMNKYSFYNFKNGNIVAGAAAMILPPIPIISRFSHDVVGLTIGKKVGKNTRKRIGLSEAESIKNLPSIWPIGGESLYWWFGGGKNRHFTFSL